MARILVVDDEPLVRENIVLALQDASHSVFEAGDGQQALSLLSRSTVDLVICDIMMPELDGIGLIREIAKQHPTLRVLCISGGGRVSDLDFLPMAEKLGAHMVLAKPFTPRQLRGAVEVVLNMTVLPMDQRDGTKP